MTSKHERQVKPETVDRPDLKTQANAQKQPCKPSELHKFDRGLRITDMGQHSKRYSLRVSRTKSGNSTRKIKSYSALLLGCCSTIS
jgi:hypothetical protein